MQDGTLAALSWFANYSNFYSILSVVICFCVMVVFILRLNGDHFLTSSATHYNVVQEQKMMSLHNPFSVQLQKQSKSSIKDGLHLEISSRSESRHCIAWGVNIQAFRKELQLPSADVTDRQNNGKLFDEQYLQVTDCTVYPFDRGYYTDKSSPVDMGCPAGLTEESLGQPPRALYPAVVVSTLVGEPISLDYTAIVVQLTVLHLKDSVCTLDTHIVYQFVKTNHNNILSLQPIFMSSSEPDIPDVEMPSASSRPAHEAVSSETGTAQHTGRVAKCDMDITRTGNQVSCDSTQVGNQIPSNTTETIGMKGGSHKLVDSKNVHTRTNVFQDQTATTTASNSMSDQGLHSSLTHNRGHSVESLRGDEVQNDVPELVGSDVARDSDDSGASVCLHLCIVCQNAAIVYTLLPCRHACVCSSCVRLLDRCPLCRGYIDAYFRLEGTVQETQVDEDNDIDDGPQLNIWQALNQRLNDILGFT